MAGEIQIEYLACRVGTSFVGIETGVVQEVFETRSISPLPSCPSYILGLTSLRGTIVPVLDFLGAYKEKETILRIVCLKTKEGLVGFLISALVDLMRFEAIRPPARHPENFEPYKQFFPLAGHNKVHFYIPDVEGLIHHSLQDANAGVSLSE